MAERKAVTRELAGRYRRASKGAKGLILNELCALTGWHRDYARRALRTVAVRPSRWPVAVPKPIRRRQAVYGEEVMDALKVVWAVLDAPCGKRLVPVMADMVQALERHGELDLDPGVRSQLLAVSAATVDRRLASVRKQLAIKGRTGTKPGSLLKGQIPIRTFSEWDDTQPGFAQIDLVAHDGGNSSGEFGQTLTLTDVASGWTENRPLRNKAQRWVVEALDDISRTLPFPLLGLDSDNGAEFINAHLLRYCTDHGLTFTRGRSYRKNDSCYVEQKNWAVVRYAVGYARYDTEPELAVLAELYRHLRLLTNFFQPQSKLISKTRNGAKISRRHDRPTTPYHRLRSSGALTPADIHRLDAAYQTLNPAQLRRDVLACQQRLLSLVRTKIHSA